MISLLKRLFLRRMMAAAAPHSIYMAKNPQFSKYKVGEWTYGCPTVRDWESHGGSLSIGHYCSIAEGVTFLVGGEHRTDWITTYPFAELICDSRSEAAIGYAKGGIHVGSDVWIGRDALILSGVTIGNGAVIGARSVVTKDVESYAIAVGNPARKIRSRIAEQLIPSMERIAWWNWPHQQVLDAVALLSSSNLEEFIKTYSRHGEGDLSTVT